MTPRAQLQALADVLRLAGTVEYVSRYAQSAWSMATPGWYLATSFDRRHVVVNSGQYLGRRWVDAIEGLHQMMRRER